jgi:hypothetical protein
MTTTTLTLSALDAQVQRVRALLAERTGAVWPVKPGNSLQSVIDLMAPGGTIALEAGTYLGGVRVWKPCVIRPAMDIPLARATADRPVTLISGGETLQIVGPDVTVIGLAARSTNPDATIVSVKGPRAVLDRLAVLGDPLKGQKRGVALNGNTALMTGCLVDDCWRDGMDAQAVATWDGGTHLTLTDCALYGSGQSFLAGGSDPSSTDRTPEDILIEHCLLSKKREWYGKAWIKCALELKNVRGVVCRHSTLEYGGTSDGQDGYIIVLTVRNQNGTAPWSTIEDVLLEDLTCRYGGGGISILGRDTRRSGIMSRIVVRNVRCESIDPTGFTAGIGRLVIVNGGPDQLTLDGITDLYCKPTAGLYVVGAGKPAPTKLIVRRFPLLALSNMTKLDDGGTGLAALQAYAPDAVIEP